MSTRWVQLQNNQIAYLFEPDVDAETAIGSFVELVHMDDNTGVPYAGVFVVGRRIAREIADPLTRYDVSSGTPTSVNVYWGDVAGRFEIINRLGVAIRLLIRTRIGAQNSQR